MVQFSNLALFVPPAFALGLGVWQLQRYGEKKEQIALRQRMLSSESGDVPSSSSSSEFTRVRVEGETSDEALFVGPRGRKVHGESVPGSLVIQAVKNNRHGSPYVLLNRGWVPRDWDANEPSQVCARTDGVIRSSERPSPFVPDNSDSHWFWIDVPTMNRRLGIPEDSPYVEATEPPSREHSTSYPMVLSTRLHSSQSVCSELITDIFPIAFVLTAT
jgi:cytochrome oxidase assembly protein ShyY1